MSAGSDEAKKQETRRVANMTPEQVSRKRAVDRSNQRTHRAKNKAYIQHLEDKVAALTYSLEQAQAKLSSYESQDSTKRHGQTATPSPSAQRVVVSQTEHYNGSIVATNPAGYGSPVADFLSKGVGNSLPFDFGSGIAVNLLDSPSELTFLGLGLDKMQDRDGSKALEAPPTRPAYRSTSETDGCATPIWQQMPNYLPPLCKLDEVVINKSQSWRQRLLKSAPQLSELSEARFPSISSLLNQPSAKENNMARPVSAVVAAEVLESPARSLVERIAFMYKLSYYIRWLVCQTEHSYHAMPEFMRPTLLQRTVPHPAWVDLITWPEARDDLIKKTDWGLYETFRELTEATVSATWVYPDSRAFTESADGRSLRLNSVFEDHIRDLKNWATDQEVADVYPYMSPYVKPRR